MESWGRRRSQSQTPGSRAQDGPAGSGDQLRPRHRNLSPRLGQSGQAWGLSQGPPMGSTGGAQTLPVETTRPCWALPEARTGGQGARGEATTPGHPQLLQSPTQSVLQDALKCSSPETIVSMVTALDSRWLFIEMLTKPQMPLTQMPLGGQRVTAPGRAPRLSGRAPQSSTAEAEAGRARTAPDGGATPPGCAARTPPPGSGTRWDGALETGRRPGDLPVCQSFSALT